MRLIIAGGRDFKPEPRHFTWLDDLKKEVGIINVVLCGMAEGADKFGMRWAMHHGIRVAEYPADWNAHGKAAGPIRNRQMAKHADAVVLFPGGRGTQSMHDVAKELGLRIFDWRERTE